MVKAVSADYTLSAELFPSGEVRAYRDLDEKVYLVISARAETEQHGMSELL